MNPLSDELKQAFERAAYSFNDWRHQGGSERLVQIGSTRLDRWPARIVSRANASRRQCRAIAAQQ
jgi:hypothetical protein